MRINELVISAKEALKNSFSERELQQHLSILFQHYLGFDRASLVLEKEKELNQEELQKFKDAIQQLIKGKPIDYIINETVFYGRPFYVDRSVLIPRPETEELVLWILEREKMEGKSILDIGTGSGCIPITLSLEGNFATIDATEISKEALITANKNAKALKATVNFMQQDILTEIPPKKYDIVVSNPPYVMEEELNKLEAKVVEYEPLIALTPKGDPLLFYKRMIEIVDSLLKKGGVFYWEIHEDLGKEVLELLDSQTFSEVELKEDLYGRDRLVRAKFG